MRTNNELAAEAEKCIRGIVQRYFFDQSFDVKEEMRQEAICQFLAYNKKDYVC